MIPGPLRRHPTVVLAASLLAVYLASGVWATRRVTATGDEPYYFLAADALLHGEGLELTGRWRHIAGASYEPGDHLPARDFLRGTSPSLSRPGRYPLHDPGLSLVIAPALAIGGRPLVVALMALASAAAVALGYRAAVAIGAPRAASFAASLALGLSAPALTYSTQVFPDAVAPLPVALALGALLGAAPPWLFGPSVAALPFLHLRYWPLALALVVVFLRLRRPSGRALAVALAPLAAVLVGLSLLDLATYGLPLPHAGFLLFLFDRRADAVLPIYRSPTSAGLLALFVDRAFGLLSAAPIDALLFFGAGMAVRRPPGRALLAAASPYLVLVSLADWTGGFSPQARYLDPLVALLVPLLALALSRPPVAIAAVPLAVWTAGQSLVYAVAPWLRYDVYGLPPLADRAWVRLFGASPSAVFPLFGTGPLAVLLAAAWLAALVALVVAGLRSAGHRAVTEATETT